MDTREDLRAQIDDTASRMVQKINALEDQAAEIKHQVQDSLTLEHHFEERPWSMFGLAAAVGFVVSRIVD